MKTQLLPGFDHTDAEACEEMEMDGLVARAVALLQSHVPEEGYYVAISGGKDSSAIKKLCQLAEVKFDAHYNQTTIDPPELVKFLKEHHADVIWERPEMPMMAMVATSYKTPPTRRGRWCCEVYKERGGNNRVKVMGVRREESAGRARNWSEVAEDMHAQKTVCPIVFWSAVQVWAFLRFYSVPYCSLYDEKDEKGELLFDRLGCVGCPLATLEQQEKEFKRWPRFRDNWKKAIIANWEKWHAVPREDGKPRYHAKFRNGEDLWQWWLTAKAPDYARDDCQAGFLWTNEPADQPTEEPK